MSTSAFDKYLSGANSDFPKPEPWLDPSVPQTWAERNWALSNPDRARRRVFEYVKERLEKTDTHVTFSEDEVYVVWFTFVLGNWKALVSTTLPDGMYYEVTYNGTKEETYLDAYKKFDNVCLTD